MKAKMYLLLLYVILVLTGLAGCSPKVHVDRDESINMTAFRTFKFVDHKDDDDKNVNPIYESSLLDKSIHTEIANQLKDRGLTESRKAPDVLVAYHTYTENKMGAVNNHYPMMYGGWGWQYYPGGLSPYPYGYWNGYNNTYQYTEGTLIIDIINSKTKVLVWRGSISDAVSDPGDLHNQAASAVKQIFKKFPLKSVNPGDEPFAKRM